MNDLHLSEVLSCTDGKLLYGGKDLPLNQLTTDSRTAGPGSLFVPIVGENLDGHVFLKSAIEKGASLVLTAEAEHFSDIESVAAETGCSVVLVDDTVRALQKIGRYLRSKVPALSVGVTGSVGKTTTREMIGTALSAAKKVYRTGKNYNNRLGVPLTLAEIPEDAEIAVLELGLNTPGELSEISRLTDLSAAVITNIGEAHLQYYGTKEQLCREKFTVTDGFTDPAKAHVLFLNGDDPYLMTEKDRHPWRVILFGLGENADYRAKELTEENGRYSFLLSVRGTDLFRVQLSVPGAHNVRNALAALAVADAFSVPLPAAAEALKAYTGYEGRLKMTEKNGILVVDDSYNASPDSMKAGVKVLSELRFGDGKGRKIAVLGDMLELGGNTERYHYETGKASAAQPVDAYFLYGPLSLKIAAGLEDGGTKAVVLHFDERAALIDRLRNTIVPGDIVYIKASHGTGLSAVSEALLKDE
ncbi:MAG: UDP-N-acetylmuramoyl-tripeptide--D-alanyl-D-alanine ligase [Lachnospiraceae bacterium]|nr:UDP-N-acetylmuramoyl-tripeptide--D-alanyl-D-alanine ligase [Lachnospiraceae bacterium]